MFRRFDRLVRNQYGDDDFLYSLLLDGDGLYVIHTGRQAALDGTDGRLRDELLASEARLDTVPPRQLSDEEHSAWLPLAHIHSVVGRTRDGRPSLYLKTRQGDFSFVFTAGSVDDIALLFEALDPPL